MLNGTFLRNNTSPTFGRLATPDEKKEMQRLIKDYMPLAPQEVDHFFVAETKLNPFWLDALIPILRLWQLLKTTGNMFIDRGIKLRTHSQKGSVDSYTWHKGIRDPDSYELTSFEKPDHILRVVRIGKTDQFIVRERTIATKPFNKK